MYKILRETYDAGVFIDKEFARKTAKLVQEHTKSSKIKASLDVYEIDEKTIKKIEENKASDTEKIFNLIRSIEEAVRKKSHENPYLISIGDKAELISLMYKQRQKDTKETLEDLKSLIREFNESQKEKIKKNMSYEVFSVYWILRQENFENAEQIAKEMGDLFKLYPYWKDSQDNERKLKQGI